MCDTILRLLKSFDNFVYRNPKGFFFSFFEMVCCCAYGCHNNSGRTRPGITFHRFPSNESLRKLWTVALRRKNWEPTRWSTVCSIHFHENDVDRTSKSRVQIKEGGVPTIFHAFPTHLQAAAVPKKKTSSKRAVKELDESLFWDFVEDVVLNEDGRLVKKLSAGCSTIAAFCNPSEIQNSQQSNSGILSENSVKFKVQVNVPKENELMSLENNVNEISPSKLGSHEQLRKKLRSATAVVDQLKTCVKRLKLENMKLHSEWESTVIKNLHDIKKDATEGDLTAIILLNKIVLYPAESL